MLKILTIAGSDPSAGAGIQSDLSVFNQLGAFGFSVITAVTSQNTQGFFKSYELPCSLIKSQTDAILSDFRIDAIKIGMLYGSSTIKTVYQSIKNVKVPIVLDPVLVSSTGGRLLKKTAMSDFVKYILPLSHSITPNIVEAKALTSMKKISTESEYKTAAQRIHRLGPKNVIIKGGHSDRPKNTVSDYILEGTNESFYKLSQKRVKTGKIHGSGCKLSAALTCFLAKNISFHDAIKHARRFTYDSIKNSKKIGMGVMMSQLPEITSDVSTSRGAKGEIESKLSQAIEKLSNLPGAWQFIPEVQTNFVYSRKNPRSPNDVMAVSGRIVAEGKQVFAAGKTKFGASTHVGNSLIEVAKQFPDIRSAINIRYDTRFLNKAKKAGLLITSYDRKKESRTLKSKEGNTVSWGTKKALSKLKDSKRPPDIIYHRGDWGKEPMIQAFGEEPFDVLEKLKACIK